MSNVLRTLFNSPTLQRARQQVSEHMPGGRAWAAKNREGSNVYAVVSSCAAQFNVVQQQIEELARQFDVSLSSDLLPDWEKSVGIPDDCLGLANTLEERRQNVIDRLRRAPVVTKADFEALGQALIGQQVTVTPGKEIETFPIPFPIVLSNTPSRFKLYVTIGELTGFVYDFPFAFGNLRSDILECVFRKVAPASVVLKFN